MEDKKMDTFYNDENLYNEKNDAVIAPDSYYADKTEKEGDPDERYYEVMDDKKPKSKIFSVISLVFGIISVLLGFLGWPALVIGVLAVTLSVVSRVKL